MRERVAIAIIFLVVLTTHCTYEYLSQGDFYYPDSFTYLTPALSMARGHGFASDDGPETLRTPGYPLFLLAFLALHAPAAAMVAANHLLDALLAAAVYALARRSGAKRVWAASGALVLAFDTITIHYANKILTETLSAAILFAIVVLLLRRRTLPSLIAIGALCGALVLVRPVALLYFGAIALWLALLREPAARIAVFVAAAIFLPIVWASRNGAGTGVVTLSSIGAVNLMSYRAAGALAIEDGGDFSARLAVRQKQLDEAVAALVREREGVESPDELTSADLTPYYSEVARPVLLHHIRGDVLMTLRGLVVNLVDSDWDALAEVVDDELIPESATRAGVYIWTWLVLLASVAGLVMLWRRDRAQAVLIAVTIAYFIFMAAGGEAEGRFRVPVIPLMAYAIAFVNVRGPNGP